VNVSATAGTAATKVQNAIAVSSFPALLLMGARRLREIRATPKIVCFVTFQIESIR
jgi:hypothetical protein